MDFVLKSVIPGAAALLAMATLAMSVAPAQAGSRYYRDDNQRPTIWMYVKKHPAEDVWRACRRVYGRDAYQARNAGTRRARCLVDISQMNNPAGYYRSYQD